MIPKPIVELPTIVANLVYIGKAMHAIFFALLQIGSFSTKQFAISKVETREAT